MSAPKAKPFGERECFRCHAVFFSIRFALYCDECRKYLHWSGGEPSNAELDRDDNSDGWSRGRGQ